MLGRIFRRRTSTGRKFIPEVDGLRFVAITSVVGFHIFAQLRRYYSTQLPPVVAALLNHGDRGVRLFFVISGFILALPFAQHRLDRGRKVSLGRYFLRRVTRLEPPYVLAILLLSASILGVLQVPFRTLGPHVLATLTYSHNLIYGELSPVLPVSWSLEVEVQFYLVVPLITALFAVRNTRVRRALIAGIIICAGMVPLFWTVPFRFQTSIGFYLGFFFAGFLVVDFFVLSHGRRKSIWWDAFSVLGWPAVFLMPDASVQLALPFLAAALYWAALNGRLLNAFFRNAFVVNTGGMCYTIYLLHFAVIAWATRLAGHHHVWALWFYSLCLLAVTSAVFFLLIERPCMNPNWPTELKLRLMHVANRRDEESLLQ